MRTIVVTPLLLAEAACAKLTAVGEGALLRGAKPLLLAYPGVRNTEMVGVDAVMKGATPPLLMENPAFAVPTAVVSAILTVSSGWIRVARRPSTTAIARRVSSASLSQ